MTTPDEVRARLGRALPVSLDPVGALLIDRWRVGGPELTGYGRQLVDAILPEVLAMLEEARADDGEDEDPEQFCDTCFAGLESSEHHEKCVAPAELAEDESAQDEQPESRRRVRRVQ